MLSTSLDCHGIATLGIEAAHRLVQPHLGRVQIGRRLRQVRVPEYLLDVTPSIRSVFRAIGAAAGTRIPNTAVDSIRTGATTPKVGQTSSLRAAIVQQTGSTTTKREDHSQFSIEARQNDVAQRTEACRNVGRDREGQSAVR
jgi:hypothetical protein